MKFTGRAVNEPPRLCEICQCFCLCQVLHLVNNVEVRLVVLADMCCLAVLVLFRVHGTICFFGHLDSVFVVFINVPFGPECDLIIRFAAISFLSHGLYDHLL